MHLHSIDLQNFMLPGSLKLTIPQRGVVAITGPNGEGKSRIVEGVSYGLWGKTLRGTDPWCAESGHVILEFTSDRGERVRTERLRKKGRISFTWSVLGSDADQYETVTKSQEALERLIGEWEVWARSGVFGGSDAAHFTTAPDAERKRLLESVLGMDRFDSALKQCRTEMKEARASLAMHERKVDIANASIEGAKGRIRDAEGYQAAAVGEDADALASELERVAGLVRKGERELSPLQAQVSALERQGGEGDALLAQLRRTLDRLRDEVCPTCTQPIPKKLRTDLEKQASAEEAKSKTLKQKAAEQVKAIHADLNELQDELDKLSTKKLNLSSRLAAARGSAQATAKAQENLTDARAQFAEFEATLAAAAVKVAEWKAEVAMLETLERVLDTRGVRAHILGRALSGLEAATNAWLTRFKPGVTVKISPYTENKSGAVADKIGLAIDGFGGGFGYKAASAGQRRRVDVAFVFAFGEFAGAVRGREDGTLFADEVFDALDDEGVDRVASALHELAATRCVLVISHNEMLVSALNAAHHWVVSKGSVTTGG